MSRRGTIVLIVVVLVATGGAWAYHWLRAPRLTPELRGFEVAQELGCFGCHGPGGTGGTPNPGSEDETVPSWDGGTPMMYADNRQDIREWVLYGHRLKDGETPGDSDHSHNHNAADEHGADGPLLHMPAYEHHISDRELEDVVSYVMAVAAFDPMPGDVREGRRVAERHGCFGCHGPGGLVGRSNRGSFKGYIPPWRGPDYRDLVRNDDELQNWILDGSVERIESNPLGRLFTSRQVIHMPAFRGRLDDSELSAIMTYIAWLQREDGKE